MGLYEKYELLQLLEESGFKTYAARRISTGALFKVHLFPEPVSPDAQNLLETLRSLQARGTGGLIEIGDQQGTAYAVTDPIPESLDAWAKAHAEATKKSDVFERAGIWRVPIKPPAPPPASDATMPFNVPVFPQSGPGDATMPFNVPAFPPSGAGDATMPFHVPAFPESGGGDVTKPFTVPQPAAADVTMPFTIPAAPPSDRTLPIEAVRDQPELSAPAAVAATPATARKSSILPVLLALAMIALLIIAAAGYIFFLKK
jgi:hypothetical protein